MGKISTMFNDAKKNIVYWIELHGLLQAENNKLREELERVKDELAFRIQKHDYTFDKFYEFRSRSISLQKQLSAANAEVVVRDRALEMAIDYDWADNPSGLSTDEKEIAAHFIAQAKREVENG